MKVLSEAEVWQEANRTRERKTTASSGIERIILSEGGISKVMVIAVAALICLFACFNLGSGSWEERGEEGEGSEGYISLSSL